MEVRGNIKRHKYVLINGESKMDEKIRKMTKDIITRYLSDGAIICEITLIDDLNHFKMLWNMYKKAFEKWGNSVGIKHCEDVLNALDTISNKDIVCCTVRRNRDNKILNMWIDIKDKVVLAESDKYAVWFDKLGEYADK